MFQGTGIYSRRDLALKLSIVIIAGLLNLTTDGTLNTRPNDMVDVTDHYGNLWSLIIVVYVYQWFRKWMISQSTENAKHRWKWVIIPLYTYWTGRKPPTSIPSKTAEFCQLSWMLTYSARLQLDLHNFINFSHLALKVMAFWFIWSWCNRGCTKSQRSSCTPNSSF